MAELLKISGCDKPERELDLIFVHGLDGDGRATWQKDNKPENCWPGWLGAEFPDIGVWSLEYAANSIKWQGHTMPLYDRARDSLDRFDLAGIGSRPVGFVCHSLGGLLVKQMLRLACEHDQWQALAGQTRFIVFLSTPHSGADLANWLNYIGKLLRASVSVQELEAHNPQLLQLNVWYRNNAGKLGIKTHVYYETQSTKGILVVNAGSADPGISGVTPIPLDDDHITICKPADKDQSVYQRVKRLLNETLNGKTGAESIAPSNGAENERMTMDHTPTQYDFSGSVKLAFYDRLGDEWRKLADILDIPSSDQARFPQGYEARGIWDWLERRQELTALPAALDRIGRGDLKREFLRHPM